MADNPYVNKVVYAGNTLIDISEDTVEASTLKRGVTAHMASGAPVTGTMEGLPAGGTTGQIMVKQSSTDYNVAWSSTPPQMGSLAMIETSPATVAHAVGDYLVYNGQLYRVTAAISAGGSLTVGNNIVATTVFSAINTYKSTLFTGVSIPSFAGGSSPTYPTLGSTNLSPGLYLIVYAATFPANANGYRQIGITDDPAKANMDRLSVIRQMPVTTSGATTTLNSSFAIDLTDKTGNTTIYLKVLQTSGETMSVNGGIQALRFR